jgi:hypothetical protein
MYTMYTRVIGLCVCLAPLSVALLSCGDDGEIIAANAECLPGAKSVPSGNRMTDPCPQNDVVSMCMPFPQYQAVTVCCDKDDPDPMKHCPRAKRWRRSCECIPPGGPMAGMGTGGAGGAGAMTKKCGDGEIQPANPFNEKCDPGNAALGKPAQIPTTCGAMNMGTGMVMCDPDSCTYDLSMCSGTNVGNSGAGGSN